MPVPLRPAAASCGCAATRQRQDGCPRCTTVGTTARQHAEVILPLITQYRDTRVARFAALHFSVSMSSSD
jgi:hypothetical protein